MELDFFCWVLGLFCVYLVKCGDGVIGGVECCDFFNFGKGCIVGC